MWAARAVEFDAHVGRRTGDHDRADVAGPQQVLEVRSEEAVVAELAHHLFALARPKSIELRPPRIGSSGPVLDVDDTSDALPPRLTVGRGSVPIAGEDREDPASSSTLDQQLQPRDHRGHGTHVRPCRAQGARRVHVVVLHVDDDEGSV